MLIRNYGLYWSPTKVFWGYPMVEGTLLGVPASNRTVRPTDFRHQIGVYVLHQNYAPIYVGQVGSGKSTLFSRLKDHRKDYLADRWNAFSWFGVIPVNPKSRRLRANYSIQPKLDDVLNHIEAILIAVIEPVMNLQRGRFGKAKRYLQFVDKNVPVNMEEQVDEIRASLRKLEKALVHGKG